MPNGRGTKRKSPNSSRTANPRPHQQARTRSPHRYGLNINANANRYLTARRRLGLNRALLRARVYTTLARHYQTRQMADIYAAVNRALTRAGI